VDPNLSEPTDTGRKAGAAAVAGFGLPLALVVYLAFAGGGYDAVVYGQVGILCWLAVLLGSLTGILPIARPGAAGWAVIALLAGLALWTATGLAWTDSSERTVTELARVASFLGVLCLAVSIQGRGAIRGTVFGLAAALALVAVMALLSRLHPELFPEIEAAQYLDDVEARLSYPVDYWNALASLMAIGIPLWLCAALSTRRTAVAAVAIAVVPIAALTAYFTLSRGGLFEVAIGLVAFLVLYPRRLLALASTLVAVAGSAILIAIATRFDALEDGLDTATAISEGNKLLVATVIVCALVAAAQLWISNAAPSWRPPAVSRRVLFAGGGLLVAAVLVVAVGAGVPAKLSDRVDEFTQAEGPEPTAGASRYESLSGNGRYQLWSSAVDAGANDPLTGTGPGTFEFWWTQDRPIDAYSRSAHSLYLNSLAEAGIIGLAIVLGFVFVPLGVGIARWRRAEAERPLYAGALAAAIVFAVAAGVDRTWDLAVLPVIFILLAAALTAPNREVGPTAPGRAPILALAGVTIASLLSIAAIAVPLAGVQALRESQADVRDGDLDAALDQARRANEIQPYAATPKYQEAQILELQGDLAAAAQAARVATDREPDNWRTWFVLARIEDEAGRTAAARTAYERSRSLNPLSDFFGDN
jgi:O-antigen ligase